MTKITSEKSSYSNTISVRWSTDQREKLRALVRAGFSLDLIQSAFPSKCKSDLAERVARISQAQAKASMTKDRLCLGCSRPFYSWGIGNRLCRHCRERGGVDSTYEDTHSIVGVRLKI